MFSPETEWLNDRFGKNYNLMYVDPLICESTLSQPWWSKFDFGRDDARFLGRFLGTLREGAATVTSFERELAGKIQRDKDLLKRAARVVEDELSSEKSFHYEDVKSLMADKEELTKRAESSKGGALVVVDGVFVHRARIPKQLQGMVQVSAQKQGSSIRSAEGVLIDRTVPIVKLPYPLAGLIVNQRMFFHWTEAFEAILSNGWYPLVRTVGLYVEGGLPYIDVLAILLRPYPSLCELLSGQTRDTSSGFSETLTALAGGLLKQEQERLEEDVKNKNVVAAGTPYPGDERFLAPIYLFQLLCQLNRVSGKGLEVSHARTFHVCQHFLSELEAFDKLLKELGYDSQIFDCPKTVAALLPELAEIPTDWNPLARVF